MKFKNCVLGVVALGLGSAIGCSGNGGKSMGDTLGSLNPWNKSQAPATQPVAVATSQPGDNQAAVVALLGQLETAINAKDWATASSVSAQLAPYNGQLTPDEKQQLAKDQGIIAAQSALGKHLPGGLPGGLVPPAQ